MRAASDPRMLGKDVSPIRSVRLRSRSGLGFLTTVKAFKPPPDAIAIKYDALRSQIPNRRSSRRSPPRARDDRRRAVHPPPRSRRAGEPAPRERVDPREAAAPGRPDRGDRRGRDPAPGHPDRRRRAVTLGAGPRPGRVRSYADNGERSRSTHARSTSSASTPCGSTGREDLPPREAASGRAPVRIERWTSARCPAATARLRHGPARRSAGGKPVDPTGRTRASCFR